MISRPVPNRGPWNLTSDCVMVAEKTRQKNKQSLVTTYIFTWPSQCWWTLVLLSLIHVDTAGFWETWSYCLKEGQCKEWTTEWNRWRLVETLLTLCLTCEPLRLNSLGNRDGEGCKTDYFKNCFSERHGREGVFLFLLVVKAFTGWMQALWKDKALKLSI